MKKILLLVIFISAFAIHSYAQTDSKRDSISINTENKLPDPSTLTGQHNELEISESKKTLTPEEIRKRKEFVKSLTFTPPQIYVGPPADEINLGKGLPYANDYGLHQEVPLGDGVSVTTSSTRNTYLTIGASQMIRANLNYQATDWLTISGGAYGAKYDLDGQRFNDAGVNAALRFQVHDRVALRAHGLYSINSNDRNRNFRPATAGMYPQTYFGGGAEFKITDKFGIEGGMVRELNPFNGKWQNRPYIMPIFYNIKR